MKICGWTRSAARRRGRMTCLGLVLAAVVMLVGQAGSAGAAGAVFVVKNTADSGVGSLRAAIGAANANPGADTIVFAIPGSGVQTIAVTSGALPAISDPVVVDGRSQPGFSGTPLIRLDNTTGSAVTGLDVTAGSTKLFALDVTGFGAGIVLEGGDGNTLSGNWIGLDTNGNADGNTVAGVRVQAGSSFNMIGVGSVASRNVISGNPNYGIALGSGGGETDNRILGNFVGTNPSGISARPNGIGIFVSLAAKSTIGGSTSSVRNVISGNTTDGVVLSGSATTANVIAGNYIGLNSSGTALGNGQVGVTFSGGAHGNQLGRGAVGGGNVISGNGLSGVALHDPGTSGNRILFNLIGTNTGGTAAVPNANHGVSISGGATANTVGGTKAAVRNVISGNGLSGVAIAGADTSKNLVVGNYIGTDVNGSAALANAEDGVTLSKSARGNSVGGAIAGQGNVISGNAGNGVQISGLAPASGDTSNNVVAGNYIGTSASGAAALPNTMDGVLIDSTADNKIGGDTAQARNLISGNKQTGVDIRGTSSFDNRVQGNYIGTDASGAAALGNVRSGVLISSGANGNTIGGSAGTTGNLISGNKASGVIIRSANTLANLISGNLIGTTASGTAALPNARDGVTVTLGAGATTIGGTTPEERNVISGNLGSGVVGDTGASVVYVIGNYIGTDVTGANPLPNGLSGVLFDGSSSNVVGGLSDARINTIAFNAGAGVKVDATSDPASGNRILRNSIDHNGGKGIVLVAGANGSQVAPTITSVTNDGTTTKVKATLTAAPSKSYRIELFSSPACDPSGAGEGATFLAAKTITTDASGNASFSILVPLVPAGKAITETATRQDLLNTSPFSICGTS